MQAASLIIQQGQTSGRNACLLACVGSRNCRDIFIRKRRKATCKHPRFISPTCACPTARTCWRSWKGLVKKAGIEQIDFSNKYTVIKIHFGEPGNLAYLRPNYAKVIVDLIKKNGGKVFLSDCNTLYVGGRKNALDHLESAYVNGFSPFSTGCHIIIGDGLKGTDEVYVPVEGGEYVKEAKIGRASWMRTSSSPLTTSRAMRPPALAAP